MEDAQVKIGSGKGKEIVKKKVRTNAEAQHTRRDTVVRVEEVSYKGSGRGTGRDRGRERKRSGGLLVYDGREGGPEVDNPPGSRTPGPASPPGSGQPPTKYTKKREGQGMWLINNMGGQVGGQ